MFLSKKSLVLSAMLLNVGLGRLNSAPLKILVINQCGNTCHVASVNWLSNYLMTVVGPQQGWTIVVPGFVPNSPYAAETLAKMRDDTLSTYQIIVLNSSSHIGNVIIDTGQRGAFQRWLKRGGGLVAWHAVMDHGDFWPWLTDSVFSGTRFTDHSPWNSTAGKTAMVRWDTMQVNGAVASNKPEYAALKAGYPSGQFNYPDEWYSLRSNPRNATAGAERISRAVDVLITLDEGTYDVPSCCAMGADHPVAWAYTLPPDGTGKRGRFIFNARGHEASGFSGTGTGAAPGGIDTAATGPTKTWIVQSIRWAAGLTQSTAITSVTTNAYGLLDARNENGVLKVTVNAMGIQVVEVFDLAGHRLGRQSGEGTKEYSFQNVKHSTMYVVQVKTGKQNYSRRIAF